MSYEFCVCGRGIKNSKKFASSEELLKWAQEQSKKIEINDLVEVIDTGFCYEYISNNVLIDFYKTTDTETFIDIINHFNHKSLGYNKGIYSIDKKDCIFKIIAELDGKYIIEAQTGNKILDYISGYYIIGKRGVKKCQEI